MKNKIIIIIVAIVIILTINWLVTSNNKEEELEHYPSDIICTINSSEDDNDDNNTYETKVYITIENNYVKSAIYQTITQNQNEDMIEAIKKIYNDIDGIDINFSKYKNNHVLTIKHDYDKINLVQIEESLGELLDEESLFKRYNKFPITYDEYKSSELKGYECHEN